MHCVQRDDAGFTEGGTKAPVDGAVLGSLASLVELEPNISLLCRRGQLCP